MPKTAPRPTFNPGNPVKAHRDLYGNPSVKQKPASAVGWKSCTTSIRLVMNTLPESPTERQRQRQTERQRQTDRDRDRHTHRDRQRDRETDKQTDRDRERQR